MFDIAAGGPPHHQADTQYARRRAVQLCQQCPVLHQCRAWFDSLDQSERPRGVIAGVVVNAHHQIEEGTTMPTNDDDIDLTDFPAVFNAVVELMPNRDLWHARFAQQPGGTAVQPDPDGWLTVTHRGDTVMRIHMDTFKPGAPLGAAQIMVDGQWRPVGLERDQ